MLHDVRIKRLVARDQNAKTIGTGPAGPPETLPHGRSSSREPDRHHHVQAVGEDAFLSGHARGVRNRVVERRSGRKVRGTFPRGFAPGGFGEGRGRQGGVRAGFVVELPVGQDPDAGPPYREATTAELERPSGRLD